MLPNAMICMIRRGIEQSYINETHYQHLLDLHIVYFLDTTVNLLPRVIYKIVSPKEKNDIQMYNKRCHFIGIFLDCCRHLEGCKTAHH